MSLSNSGTNTSQPAAPTATNMFGSTSQSQPQQQQQTGSSMFGNTLNTPKPTGGLFAGSAATPQPQQTNSSLFGGPSTTPASQTQPAAAATMGGGLFGTAPAHAATSQPQQQQTGTSLFGNTNQTQTQPQAQGGGLFSSLAKPAQQTTNTVGSLFGSSTQQKPSLL